MLFKIVPIFIGFVFCVIVAFWVGLGYVAYNGYQAGPDGLGRAVGKFIGGIESGRKE
jgi:hypothetical protein